MSTAASSRTSTPTRPPPPVPKRPPSPSFAVERPPTDWRTVILVNLVSLVVHGLILGACALIILDRRTIEEIFSTLSISGDPDLPPIILPTPIQPKTLEPDQAADPLVMEDTSKRVAETAAPSEFDFDDLDPSFVPDESSAPAPNINPAHHFAGRTAAAKAALVKQFGGTAESEAAVASGLRWLARRQFPDGTWSFDHTACAACAGGGCSQPGFLQECRNGATALALLAFLGGGHTHQSGDYQRVVRAGLEALLRGSRETEYGRDFRDASGEGNMYVHGLAAIALCETAALTQDVHYSKPAYQAVRFIVAAQDPDSGGWRYRPRTPGDTSVVGWQLMALKSAQSGKLKVPAGAFKLVDKFLNRVQGERGAVYGYRSPPRSFDDASPTMTAVGLLCRMYMGWDQKNKHLQRGVAYLDRIQPSPTNMYYNYYATQVLHHFGGDEWTRWNNVMRDHLVRTQVTNGIESGSWDVTDPHGAPGGRLYQTCLAVMTLEVYYRHLPIYQRDKVKIEY